MIDQDKLAEVMDSVVAQYLAYVKDGQFAPTWLPFEGGIYRKYHFANDLWALGLVVMNDELESSLNVRALIDTKMRALKPMPAPYAKTA